MSSSTSDPKASESNAKQKINKSFTLLKSHATKVASFTLQWQELEDHFREIGGFIDSSFQQLQYISDDHEENRFLASDGNAYGTDDDSPTAEETPNSPPGLTGVPVTDGTSLMLFVKNHRCEHEEVRAGLRNALKRLENPGKLVLESLRAYRGVGTKFSVFRRCCVTLLEAFMKVGANVGAQEKEEAMEMALKWKAFMRTGTGSWGILGFLAILAGFGLLGNFDADEVFKLFEYIVKNKKAPELLKALGFADKAPDLIELLISQNKPLVAIKYIYAFGLVDKFPPVALLKDHARRAKEVTKTLLYDESSSLKNKHMAVSRELVALKAILEIVHSHKLVSEYSVVSLNIRLQKLKNKSRELHAALESSDGKHQGRKRGRKKEVVNRLHSPAILRPLRREFWPQIVPFTVPAENTSYLQSASMFADQGARNLTSSARVDSERTTHNSFVGDVSTIPNKQPFHHQPQDLMPNQVGVSHFGYNRTGTPTHFSPHTNSASAVGPYGSLGAAPSNSQVNLPGKLASSESTSTVAHYSLSGSQYGGSNISTSSKGQQEGPQAFSAPSSHNHDLPGRGRYYTGPAVPNNVGNCPIPRHSVPIPYHHPGAGMTSGYYGAPPSRPRLTNYLEQHYSDRTF